MIKRLFDFLIALAGLILLVPLLPFIWLTNLLISRRPLFSGEEVVGRDNRRLRLYRLRFSENLLRAKSHSSTKGAENEARHRTSTQAA
jgi:lipopolysaccharide/colanic/teichoic acid biosynthesis glycosyltransferase